MDQITAIMAAVHRAERRLGLAGLPALAAVLVIGVWRWHLARFWIWFFFERVEVRHPERVPRMGPVLLCINHPNNLVDSLLVGSVLPRERSRGRNFGKNQRKSLGRKRTVARVMSVEAPWLSPWRDGSGIASSTCPG